jgi:hypothetical protein
VRLIWLAFIALGSSSFASAATLGSLAGSARLGSPLEVRVPVQWGPDESADNLCIRPSVSFGDVPLGPSAFSFNFASTDSRSGSLTIRTNQVVNEPFVSVSLRVGCGSVFQRKYLLLADFPVTDNPGASLGSSGSLEPKDVAVTPVAPRIGGRPVALDGVPVRVPSSGLALDVELGASKRPAKPRSVVKKPEPSQAASTNARLTLLPVDLRDLPDLDPSLRLTFNLGAEPSANEEQRKAAAAAWRVLGASFDDRLAMALQLDTLQNQSSTWTKAQSDQAAALEELTARNAQLEAQRFTHPLIWILAALALLGLGLALWMWRRQSRLVSAAEADPTWWTPSGDAAAAPDSEMGSGSALTTIKSTLTKAVGADGKPLAVSKVTMPSSRLSAEPSATAEAVAQAKETDTQAPAPISQSAPLSTLDRRDFLPSLMGVSRSVATEELLDVQQQADFFVSLGDHDQAIRILRTHISESAEPSPIFYLDLFKIFHKLGRRDDYAALRDEFNQVFNAEAPPFAEFMVQGRGLDAFAAALAAITECWPQPQVLDVIEQYLFRSPGQADVFDLDAYRELLMLYGVAKEIINSEALAEVASQEAVPEPLPELNSRAGGLAASAGAAATMAMEFDFTPDVKPGSNRSWDEPNTPLPSLSLKDDPLASSPAPSDMDQAKGPKKSKGPDLDVDLDFL